jgi:hypothetical protein
MTRRSATRLLLVVVAMVLALPSAPARAQSDSGPSQVFVGAYINDVKHVDVANNSYSIDVYLWMRWDNPDIDPSKTIQALNPADSWVSIEPFYDEPMRLRDGSLYNVIRYLGSFSGTLALHDYPFDRQVLTITLEDTDLSTADLVYVVDPLSNTLANPAIDIPGWVAEPAQLRVTDYVYPSNWGSTDVTGLEAYSRVVIELPVNRPVLSSAFKMFFPLGIVLLTGVLTFFLKPSMIESKVGTSITALLTLVALQFTVMGALPAVGYLTMIEVIYALSFLFVLYTLGTSISTAWSTRDPQSVEAVRFDRRTLVIGFAGYLVAITVTLIVYLN